MAHSNSETAASRPASGPASQQRIRSRTHSISSDRPSTNSFGLMSPPLSVSPEAAFIAGSAASQIVTNDHDSHANTWYDEHGIEPSGEAAIVSPAALQLVNNFLDQLLFNFLSISRSTSLATLRPAVTEVLKPKLAKDAINQADEELREYLGGGDDDDMLQAQPVGSPQDWDIELIWKRTRLRCMVYSSLGDMEEEDEDYHMEQGHLGPLHDGSNDGSNDTVSPAVAIFLTSILEFMGEQVLISAGQAAFHRMRFVFEKERKELASPGLVPVVGRVTVDEVDMERVAFDRTIGRLWRSWKKRIRSPVLESYPCMSPRESSDLSRAGIHSRQFSQGALEKAYARNFTARASPSPDGTDAGTKHDPQDAKRSNETSLSRESSTGDVATGIPLSKTTTATTETTEMADIPEMTDDDWLAAATVHVLPVNENDIAEILIPGFAQYVYSDDEEDADQRATDMSDSRRRRMQRRAKEDAYRPASLLVPPHTVFDGLPTPTTSEPHTPEIGFFCRKRANSLPTPSTSPHLSPQSVEDDVIDTTVDEVVEAAADVSLTESPEESPEDNLKVPTTAVEADVAVAEVTTTIPSLVEVSKPKRKPVPQIETTLIGAAITTAAHKAVPMVHATSTGVDEEIDDFTEEPEILTSSRVSISGRSSSPTSSDRSRPLSISPVLPPGSPSLHSPRVIDVSGPRSPTSRSRGSSMDMFDPVLVSRTNTLSRASSVSTPAIAEEAHREEGEVVTTVMRASYIGSKVTRTYTNDSISEAEEIYAETPKPESKPSKKPQQLPLKQMKATMVQSRGMSSPVASPLHPPTPMEQNVSTKVTILKSTQTPGSFFIDDVPSAASQPQQPLVDAAAVKSMTIPQRSPKRGSAVAAPAPVAVMSGALAMVDVARKPSLGQEYVSNASQVKPQAQIQVEAQQPEVDALAEVEQTSLVSVSSPEPSPIALHQNQPVASSSLSVGSRYKTRRPSEESTAMRPEDVARNFEQLIHSDQTIQYTLTPENMRDIDGSNGARSSNDGSASIIARSRKSEDVRQAAERSRSRSSSVATSRQMDVKRSASISRANVPEPSTVGEKTNGSSRLSGPVPRMPHGMSPQSRNKATQARDARIPRESMSEFADFIRETGPSGRPGMNEPVPAHRKTSIGSSAVAGAPRKASSMATLVRPGVGARAPPSTAGSSRSRYTAREATVDYKDDNSDLIDFIRRGPPDSGGNPRIPRTVAPFRSTMDSDQMTSAVGGHAVDAMLPSMRSSAASTNFTESSNGSSAGLLRNKAQMPAGGNEEVMMPKRKTRRVRDPYAIDISDEEDEEIYASTGRKMQPPIKEESLLDFLNSVPPPMDSRPVPFDVPQTRNQKQGPRKKASAPSLMSRLVRGNSGSGSSLSSRSRFFGGSSSSNTKTNTINASVPNFNEKSRMESRSLYSRAGSTMSKQSYVPLQVNIPPSLDKYGASSLSSGTMPRGQSSYNGSSRRPPATANGASGGMPRKKFEPREAKSVSSRATQDLADFLRNSGPA